MITWAVLYVLALGVGYLLGRVHGTERAMRDLELARVRARMRARRERAALLRMPPGS